MVLTRYTRDVMFETIPVSNLHQTFQHHWRWAMVIPLWLHWFAYFLHICFIPSYIFVGLSIYKPFLYSQPPGTKINFVGGDKPAEKLKHFADDEVADFVEALQELAKSVSIADFLNMGPDDFWFQVFLDAVEPIEFKCFGLGGVCVLAQFEWLRPSKSIYIHIYIYTCWLPFL